MLIILLIIIIIGIAILEVRMKQKLENDQKIMEKLDILIDEVKKR